MGSGEFAVASRELRQLLAIDFVAHYPAGLQVVESRAGGRCAGRGAIVNYIHKYK